MIYSYALCPQSHKLVHNNDNDDEDSFSYKCNRCGRRRNKREKWHCNECEYDLCIQCYDFINDKKTENYIGICAQCDLPHAPKKGKAAKIRNKSDNCLYNICAYCNESGNINIDYTKCNVSNQMNLIYNNFAYFYYHCKKASLIKARQWQYVYKASKMQDFDISFLLDFENFRIIEHWLPKVE